MYEVKIAAEHKWIFSEVQPKIKHARFMTM